MGKHSTLDDEVPLTLQSPSRPVMQETRSRFDHLLRVALSQEKKDKRKKRHKEKIENIELPVRSGRSLGDERGQHNEAFSNDLPKTSSSRKHAKKLPPAHNDNQLHGAHNISTATLTSGLERTSSSDDDVHVIKRKNDINNGANESSTVGLPQPKPRRKRVSEDTRTENQALDDGKTVDTGHNIHSDKDRIVTKSFDSNSDNDVTNEDFDDSRKQERRLSYVIEKANDPFSTPSISRKISPEFVKPTPLPRIKTAKGKRRPLPDVHNTQSSQHSAREVSEENSSRNVSTSSPNITIDNVQAPPLYSQTSASYENLEKDGGPIVKVHRVSKARRKVEVGEEIEMQTLGLSAPVASYEEITPSRKSQQIQEPSSPEHEARVSVSACPSTSAQSDRGSSDLNYDKIIGVIVHKCDVLQMDSLIRHPLVKVYIVDSSTGEYMKKSDPKRSVSYFNEQDEVDYVAPLMTHEFNFLARRSMVPCWEELLIFNEDFTCIMKRDAPVIILFEILDFVSFAVASSRYKKLGPEGGWHKVAWGFLKPVGANDNLNVGEPRRLQLYKPQQYQKTSCDSCDVYSWWNRGDWQKYPGTIYVTVKGIQPPENLPPAFRSIVALQGEISFPTELSVDEDRDNSKSDDIALPSMSENNPLNASPVGAVSWSRMAAQSCKVPNKRTMTLPTASKGCFTLKFSHAGLYLACATLSKSTYTILVYAIPDGKEFAQLTGHQGLVYDLNWSSNDKYLLSASSDSTACVWGIKGKKQTQLVQMLPHPTFVYCARFLANNNNTVITGCNDHVLRIWSKARRSSLFQLVQEYEEHKGFVTALCFDRDGMLISGDSVGRIIVWPSLTHSHFAAESLRDLSLRELQDTVINGLVLHPGGQRLLVHARDNLLRMVDLTTASIIQWFHGALNYRVQTFACITPCGGLVLAASEDGTIRVWNADTGDEVAIYSGLQFSTGSSGVDYHPFEHMAAFSSTGNPVGVALCTYDKSANGGVIGLAILADQPLAPEVDQKIGEERNQSKIRLPPIPGDVLRLSRKNNYHHTGKDLSSSNVETADESSVSGFSQHSHSFLTSTRDSSRQYKGDAQPSNKLSNIIDKIDQVLSSTTHSKTNSHISSTSTPKEEDVEVLETKNEIEKRSSARSRRQALN